MYRQVLLLAALGLVTSCVPAERDARVQAARQTQVVGSRELLRALALRVPDDALPPRARVPFVLPLLSAPPFLASAETPDDAVRATECLTQAVYYEARSEPIEGQRAVAQVVLNRVRDRAFPHSVCGVVYQRGTHTSGCQFTFACDGAMNAPREPRAWARARAVAVAALTGSVYAPVGAAVFYHTQAVSPWWAPSLSRIGSIGSHIFYRWHDALAGALSFRERYSGLEPIAGRAVPTTVPTAFRADLTEESGVTVHREHAGGAHEPRVVESAGVRIHLGIAPTRIGTETDGRI